MLRIRIRIKIAAWIRIQQVKFGSIFYNILYFVSTKKYLDFFTWKIFVVSQNEDILNQFFIKLLIQYCTYTAAKFLCKLPYKMA